MRQAAKTQQHKHAKAKAAFILVTCAVMSCALSSAQAEVLPETAKLIPPETIVLAEIGNFSQLKAQFEKTNLYKLYKDPAMADFISDTKTKWRTKMKEEKDEIVKVIVDANVLPEGRVAVALVFNEQAIKAEEPQVLLIAQWGKNTSKIKEAIEKQVEKDIEEGLHKKSEDYRGISIVTMVKEIPPKKVPDWSNYNPEGGNTPPMKTIEMPPEETSYCFVDDYLLVSDNIDIVKFVIAHIKGATSPTLANEASYSPTVKAIGPYHDVDLYVNIKQITKAIIAGDATGQAQRWVTNLGFDNVVSAGYAMGIARKPGSSACGKAFLKIEGAKKGIFKMLDIESTALKAPQFISESAYSATFLNLNIKKAYDELCNIANAFSPQAAAIMYTPLLPDSPDGEPGVQLERDIIEHMGSQVVIAQSINKPFSKSSSPRESLVALAVNNRSALERTISVLYDKMIAPNNPDARRKLLGYTIYLIDLPALLPAFMAGGRTPMQVPGEPTVPQMPKMAFTATDTHLIFGSESAVEGAIRRLSSATATSVASKKWFSKTKAAIPSVVGLAGLEDNAASWELLWWTMKEASKAESGDSGITMGLALGPNPGLMFSQIGLFNFGLLPEFEAVRKYFGLSAFYGVSRPDGFFFEFKYLNPSTTD